MRKCGEILGVTPKLDKEQRDAKHILEHIFFQVVEFKKLNQVSVRLTTSDNTFLYTLKTLSTNCSLPPPQERDMDPEARFPPL